MIKRLAVLLCFSVAFFGCKDNYSEVRLVKKQEVNAPVPTEEPAFVGTGINKPLEYFCDYKYAINHGIVPVCSQFELTQAHLDHVEDQLLKTLYLYRNWIGGYGYSQRAKGRRGLVIYFVTFDTINDKEMFPRHKGTIVGRYVTDGSQRIFVTDRVFKKKGYVDFVHEAVHWFNEELGITNTDENEKIAFDFESHYESMTPFELQDFMAAFVR